jgi:predicted transposase YbfD/YdcC
MTLIRIECKQTSESKWETRYYISSHAEEKYTPSEWGARIRKHWVIENGNHWRKDATLREDQTRTRDPWIMSNLIMLRNLVLHFFEQHRGDQHPWLPSWIEINQEDRASVFALVTRNA